MAEDLNADAVPNVVRNDSSSDSTTEPGTRTVPLTVRQTDEEVDNYISGTCEENEHGVSSVPTFSTVSNNTRRQVTQKWRDDYRCGDGYTTGDGRTAECDPDSNWPCCSSANWCGNTAGHCYCAGCVYYHNTESADRKLEKIITIGERGKEPRMTYAYGVAVSADNEIFVTHLEGVHVFSINGNYLRRFPTVLPGKNGYIMPYDVAIGIEPGHLWVVGVIFESGANEGRVQVVTYSRSGQAMKKFDLGFTGPSSLPSIAIDVRNNKIIVGQGNTVKMFDPDGSLYRSFKASSGSERGMIGGVTSDTDNGKHRVDMFTNRGVFVRTIANNEYPSGIAMGPDGEMVVTKSADRKLEKIITIGERGKEPRMTYAYGVAVSADNEIFVTHLEGVHVFSINGNYLRRFPTVLPGKNGYIMPYDVAIGIEPGHLWVVGVIFESGANEGRVQVVTYSRSGQAMKKFDLGFTGPSSLPSIAIDVRNNKIIVGQGNTVKMFDPDGSLYRSFKASSGSERGMIGGVTSDSEGNILLTLRHKAVEMYSHSGVKIFEFAGRGKGQMNYGICLDKFGNIFVADNGKHRVDMFTNRGVFVRTIANNEYPSGIAMGPDGEMVVTSAGLRSTVTIFPRHMVLP
ncbi:hypothetical protein Bbelb_388660 [Branchiostoma belcheri]|nr:hypothetical protein Bbelb_388660 [Branchiostoma belcheri]